MWLCLWHSERKTKKNRHSGINTFKKKNTKEKQQQNFNVLDSGASMSFRIFDIIHFWETTLTSRCRHYFIFFWLSTFWKWGLLYSWWFSTSEPLVTLSRRVLEWKLSDLKHNIRDITNASLGNIGTIFIFQSAVTPYRGGDAGEITLKMNSATQKTSFEMWLRKPLFWYFWTVRSEISY